MHSLLSSILHNQYPRAETIISEIMAPCIPYMYTKGIEIIGVIVPWIIFILAVALKASNPARAPAWTLFSVEMNRRSAPETIIGDKSGRLRVILASHDAISIRTKAITALLKIDSILVSERMRPVLAGFFSFSSP